MKRLLSFILMFLLAITLVPVAGYSVQTNDGNDTGELGNSWGVDSDGDIYPKTDSAQDIGASGSEVDVLYVDEIYLGGTSKTSWGSVVSPMTDASGYVYPTDSGAVVRFYDTGYINLGAGTAVDVYLLLDTDDDDWYIGRDDTDNDFAIGVGSTLGTDERISIADDTNNTIITIGDGTNSYDHYVIFDGNAVDFFMGYMDTTDMLWFGYGSTPDTNMCFGVESSATPLLVIQNGIDANGAVDLDYGSADVTDHTFVSDGGTLILDGTITLTNSAVISNATNNEIRVEEAGDAVLEVYTANDTAGNASLRLSADLGDAVKEQWEITSNGTSNDLLFTCDTAVSGTPVTQFTIADGGIVTSINVINPTITNASNSTVTDLMNLTHDTSGTSTAGIGAGLVFKIEDGGDTEEQASIDAVLTTVTNGAEDCDLVFNINTAGAIAEVMRIVGASSATTGDSVTITQNTTETDAIVDILSLANVTGTATHNTGLGITWDFEDAGGAEEQASLDVQLIVATDSSESADFIFSAQTAGTVAEILRLWGSQSATASSGMRVTGNTSETNGVVDVFEIYSATSGTVASGLGVGITIDFEDAGGIEEQGSLDLVLTTETNGSEDVAFVFSQNTAGAIAETLRIQSASSATVGDYLQITSNTTETDGVIDALKLTTSAVTGATGNGIGILFSQCDAGGAEEQGAIDNILTTATNASEVSDFSFKVQVGGAITEMFLIDGTGGIQVGGGGDVDYTLTFNANTNDGLITWKEDEDNFTIADEVLITDQLTANIINVGVDSGSDGTDYVVTCDPVPSAMGNGMFVIFQAVCANGGACSLNVNSLGAKPIKKLNDQDPSSSHIEAGQMVMAIYDSTATQWEIIQPDSNP